MFWSLIPSRVDRANSVPDDIPSWLMLGDTEANVSTTDLESDYEIIGELGRGATAVVYRARDRELGREVAIKVIRPKYADDDETVARLAREARTVAQLQHPNIVTLYAVRRIRDGSLALVMQLVPGRAACSTRAVRAFSAWTACFAMSRLHWPMRISGASSTAT
jgi:hypothetical protein